MFRLFKELTLPKRVDQKKQNSSTNDLPLDLKDPDIISRFSDIVMEERNTQTVCPLNNGGILLLNPSDVKDAFSQKRYSNEPSRFSAIASKNKNKYIAAQVASNIPPFLDAPRHTYVRKWLSKCVFSTLSDFQAKIGPAAAIYVDSLPAHKPLLLVEKVAREFVTSTISDFVGVSLKTDELKRYTTALFKLFAPIDNANEFENTNQALQSARDALLAELAARTHDKSPSLLTSLIQSTHLIEDLDLSEEEIQLMIVDNALLVLADGVENVEAAIGEVLVRFSIMDREERLEITESFVRSSIHKTTPGQTIARIASDDMHISGEKIASGSPVFLSLAGANAREDDGTDFSFGLGRHRCIGERLAVEIILSCSRALASRGLTVDMRNLHFEPIFGHRWMRGVKLVLS